MKAFKNRTPAIDRIKISNFLLNIGKGEIIRTILDGLTAEQKSIASKYFYDDRGASLFEMITLLPEYYLTRCETSILHEVSGQLVGKMQDIDILEIGSGEGEKISILLEAIPAENMDSVRYIPVDVNQAGIEKSALRLISRFPGLKVHGVVADFGSQLGMIACKHKRLICFFGSTLGNFSREGSMRFFVDLGGIMEPADQLLLGVDMVKNREVLHNAYNDSKNITAEFNRNILSVANKLVGTDFKLEMFNHVAFYNEDESRIEMYLEAAQNQEITCPHLAENIIIKKGERIHTENSHKYTSAHLEALAQAGKLEIKDIFTDKNRWFSLILFEKK
jgi:L-histidine N-alpha-methyltransferase